MFYNKELFKKVTTDGKESVFANYGGMNIPF